MSDHYSALIYLGSTYDEPLPEALLDDVLRTRTPVMWVNENISQLTQRAGDFAATYGWEPARWDRSHIARDMRSRTTSLTRSIASGRRDHALPPHRLASVRATRTAIPRRRLGLPRRLRSRNLHFSSPTALHIHRARRIACFVFDDLLFGLLAPQTRQRHRGRRWSTRRHSIRAAHPGVAARLRLPPLKASRSASSEPVYRDPQGHDRTRSGSSSCFATSAEVVSALHYLTQLRRASWSVTATPASGTAGATPTTACTATMWSSTV